MSDEEPKKGTITEITPRADLPDRVRPRSRSALSEYIKGGLAKAFYKRVGDVAAERKYATDNTAAAHEAGIELERVFAKGRDLPNILDQDQHARDDERMKAEIARDKTEAKLIETKRHLKEAAAQAKDIVGGHSARHATKLEQQKAKRRQAEIDAEYLKREKDHLIEAKSAEELAEVYARVADAEERRYRNEVRAIRAEDERTLAEGGEVRADIDELEQSYRTMEAMFTAPHGGNINALSDEERAILDKLRQRINAARSSTNEET